MIKLFINGTDLSSHMDDGSLSIVDQIQNKANTAYFTLKPGIYTAPEENQEVKTYDTVQLVSASGTEIIVKDTTRSGLSVLPSIEGGRGKYRVGQTFWLGIGTAGEEKVTIGAIVAHTTAGQVKITSTVAVVNAHSANENCGKLIFGGVIMFNDISNPHLLADVQYQISCSDYTKIFDKKNINDSWTSVDARYIINDFCNTTVNYNAELDDMEYADNTAVQAEWIESGDGTNPTNNTTTYIQGSGAVLFNWTNSGGTATFSATPTSTDLSPYTKVASGTPTQGNVTFWYKRTSATGMSSIAVRTGSDNTNYCAVSFTPEADTDWHFISLPLDKGTVTGTPVWTASDYLAFVISETTSSSMLVDDVRLTADGSFTLYNVESTIVFDDVRASFKKPTDLIDAMANKLSYYWFIDYERDIHFFDRESTTAPYSITDTSDNFYNLKVNVDTSQLKNRQTVRGGTNPSTNFYTQVVQGDNATREWVLKSKFETLSIYLDNNTSTDLTEAGTTTTTINATGHGLATGDWIVNRTRSAAREVTVVDPNQFTVLAVASQTNGDTFSKFATTKTVGVENLVDETTVNYVSNYNEKSIRPVATEATLTTTDYLLFKYKEVFQVIVTAQDVASVASLKAIIGGDGIFDGAVITDKDLDTLESAQNRAQAEIDQWANPIVKISFITDHEGLESGQLLSVTDTNKGINDDYVIQRVKTSYKDGGDYPVMEVQAASSLFGIIEYFQKLNRDSQDKLIDSDAEITPIIQESMTITISEANQLTPSESIIETATITITPTTETAVDRDMTTTPYKWQPDANETKWNLFQWG